MSTTLPCVLPIDCNMEDSRKLLSDLMSNATALSDALSSQSSSQNGCVKFSSVEEECSSLFRGKPSSGYQEPQPHQRLRPTSNGEPSG